MFQFPYSTVNVAGTSYDMCKSVPHFKKTHCDLQIVWKTSVAVKVPLNWMN